MAQSSSAAEAAGLASGSCSLWVSRRAAAVAATCGAALLVATALTWGAAAGSSRVQPGAGRALRAAAAGGNPFAGVPFYVNPSYQASLRTSINTSVAPVKATLESMLEVPSAYWIDVKAKLRGAGTQSMAGILRDAAAKSPPQLVVFIVYDLPNRDCHAKASNGEICCKYKADGRCDYGDSGDCADGLREYKESYVDPMAEILREFNGKVPMVLVIEPDSLPNLSTNQADPRCGNEGTRNAYKRGVAYAVSTLAAAAPAAALYLDAGHGGWLGWENNMNDFAELIGSLGVAQHLRGFASNVAGYNPLGRQVCPSWDWCFPHKNNLGDPCCADPCRLTIDYNPSVSELNYALHLRKAMSAAMRDFEPHMIIDTGRNGVDDVRSQCKNWCNIRGAGVGHLPTAGTAAPDLVDAYFWLKTPGESDGCTQKLPDGNDCPRFDADCASPDSIGTRGNEPRAPEAGAWFDFQIKQLAANANMQR